jgi:hypothetical protein
MGEFIAMHSSREPLRDHALQSRPKGFFMHSCRTRSISSNEGLLRSPQVLRASTGEIAPIVPGCGGSSRPTTRT